MNKEKESYNIDVTKLLKAIIWIFLLASFLVPLIYDIEATFPFVAPRAFFFMAMVQMAFFAWVILAITNVNYRPKMEPVTIAVSAFIGAMTLSTILGANPFYSFWSNYERMSGLLIYLHFFAFFLVLSSIIKGKEQWIKLIGWVAAIASIVSLISLAHNFGLIELPPYFQVGSTLANTSFMGSYLLAVSFFCLYGLIVSWRAKKFFLKVFLGVNFVIITSAVMLNPGGRAMKGAFLIGIILLFLLYLAFANRDRVIRNVSRFILIAGLLASLYVGLFAFVEGSFVRERIEGLHGMSARFLVWEMAWEGFKERPLLGWGPENFPLVFQKEFDPQLRILDGGEIWFDRAHNVVFDSLVTVGALGMILFFGMFLTALALLWREFFKKGNSEIWAPAVFTSFFAAYFIQNLTVFDMISSSMLLFVLFAFASSSSERKISDSQRAISATGPIIVFGALLIATLNIFVMSPYKANISAGIALMYPIELLTIENYERAFAGSVDRDDTIFAAAERITRDQAKYELRGKEKKNVIQNMEFILKTMERAIDEEPRTFKGYWLTGRMYNEYYYYYLLEEIMRGDPAKKAEFIKKARETTLRAKELISAGLEISPRNQQGYWDLVQAEANMGNIYIFSGQPELSDERFRRAFTLAEEAVELEPRNLEAQMNLLQVTREIVRDPVLVRKKVNEALAVDPSWKPALERYME